MLHCNAVEAFWNLEKTNPKCRKNKMLGRETPGQKDRYYVFGCDVVLPADLMQFSTVLHARRTRIRVGGVTTR
ncbi:uncharacterized protein Bfra_006548 [Botrytis fragariae]|uniref:Uncharacterized protein n=1 Tax=Botrytis fragariae TaxID=1964551 RepID=A0A8H6B4Z3_9HELO|nr:uncharacterized protein Bfra_006548 [Botrytis fragariae]KAF5879340.1 hypothetical protein Bfra_006548 [Botrytis fragariae]